MNQNNTGRVTDRRLDFFKGIAILLIVIGRNHVLTDAVPWLFRYLYLFHVVQFFLIMGLREVKPLNLDRAIDLAVRYLTPFVLFIIPLSALFQAMFHRGEPLGDFFVRMGLALVIGSAPALDDATGFQLYWFLPAILSLSLAWGWACGKGIPGWVVALSIAAHVTVGLVPQEWVRWVPLGLLPTAYVFALLLAVYGISQRMDVFALSPLKTLPAFAVVSALALWEGVGANLAMGAIPDISAPVDLVLTDLMIMTAFLAIVSLANWGARFGWLGLIGRNSLPIFLTHQVFYQSLAIVLPKLLPGYGEVHGAPALMLGAALVLVCMIPGLVLAWMLERLPALQRHIFPQTLADLLGRTKAR